LAQERYHQNFKQDDRIYPKIVPSDPIFIFYNFFWFLGLHSLMSRNKFIYSSTKLLVRFLLTAISQLPMPFIIIQISTLTNQHRFVHGQIIQRWKSIGKRLYNHDFLYYSNISAPNFVWGLFAVPRIFFETFKKLNDNVWELWFAFKLCF